MIVARFRRRLATGILLPLLCNLCANAVAQNPVVVARVVEAEVSTGQRVVGTVYPLRTSIIGSAAEGRVDEMLVNQGEAVQQGQVLARLRTRTLEIEQAASEAELRLAEQRLAELQNGSRPDDIAEAEANMLGAQAALKHAEANLQRIVTLEQTKAASKSELADAREEVDAARFAAKAIEAQYSRIKDGPRVEMIAQAEAQVELQRQRLNLIVDQISKYTLEAPFDGFVSAEFTEAGAWLSQGDPIAEVVQLDEIEIQAAVTAEAVVDLRIGDAVRVEFPELPNELLTGTIERIVPVAAARTRTYPVIVRAKNHLRNGLPVFLGGMLVRVDLPAGSREKLPLVPKDALVLNGQDRCVFVVDAASDNEATSATKSGTVRKVAVSLGVAVADRIQVRGDLRADDMVVVVGNERLIPGSTVTIVQEVDTSRP